jgi:hypothetical protein
MAHELRAVIGVGLAMLAGCASTGVVPTDPGVYMISKKSAAGVFGTPEGVRADIYVEANQFCAQKGKAVETVNLDVKEAVPFERTGSATLLFKCIAPGDADKPPVAAH